MLILVACEFSGVVRDAFAARGHDAWSCDLLPTERPGNHHQGDVMGVLDSRPWDMLVAFPPCTYLCGSGLHWNKRRPGRAEQTEAALGFVRALLDARVPRIALENPVGCIGTRIRPADQTIQPYDFGADASKRTCLWLKNLPPLKPTKRVPGRLVEYPPGSGRTVERWDNQTDGGQNKLGPSADRAHERSRTYQGIADAMAAQWSEAVPQQLSLFAVA